MVRKRHHGLVSSKDKITTMHVQPTLNYALPEILIMWFIRCGFASEEKLGEGSQVWVSPGRKEKNTGSSRRASWLMQTANQVQLIDRLILLRRVGIEGHELGVVERRGLLGSLTLSQGGVNCSTGTWGSRLR
jgi:hypothetical protein